MVHFTGVLFEAATEAMKESLYDAPWTVNRELICIRDFQKILRSKFGTLEVAWRKAFDVEQLGYINFTKFNKGCKTCGFCGDVSRLWKMLDKDLSGEISQEEMAVPVGEYQATMPYIDLNPP